MRKIEKIFKDKVYINIIIILLYYKYMAKTKKNQQSESSNIGLQKLKAFINLDDLPDDLKISTMTITCNLDTNLDVVNIGKYIELSENGIVTVKHGDKTRTLIVSKKNEKKKKKPRKAFYNQVTIIKRSKDGKNTNVKLFKNGSIQMTGCKGVNNFIEVMTILCNELLKTKAIIDPVTMNKIIIKPFVTNKENVDILKVTNIKVRMINSNFNIGFKLDREKLYALLLKMNVECTYEPCVHACVNVKFEYNGEKISIFVFESGSIIITGAKLREHVVNAYKYITTILYENYAKIFLRNLDSFIKRDDIQLLLDNADINENDKDIVIHI